MNESGEKRKMEQKDGLFKRFLNKWLLVSLLSGALLFTLMAGCKRNFDTYVMDSAFFKTGPENIRWGSAVNTQRGVTITWESDRNDDLIEWGYSEAYEQGKAEPIVSRAGYRYAFQFTFPLLKPSSLLYYRIRHNLQWGTGKYYQTPVDSSAQQFSFAVGGDGRAGSSVSANERWKKMAGVISAQDIDFFIHLGDVVNNSNNHTQWITYFRYGQELTANRLIFYTWGNHEFGALARQSVTLPGNKKWYSFTQGNALFICLLSEKDFDIQYDWLRRQLEKSDKEWIIVYFHKPFFTHGPHEHEMDKYRKTWWKTFDDYGVDVVLNGHVHSYIRTRPLNLNVVNPQVIAKYGSAPDKGRLELVSGGLGSYSTKRSDKWYSARVYSGLHFIKFNVDGKKLHFDTITDSGAIIDSLTIISDRNEF